MKIKLKSNIKPGKSKDNISYSDRKAGVACQIQNLSILLLSYWMCNHFCMSSYVKGDFWAFSYPHQLSSSVVFNIIRSSLLAFTFLFQ